MISLIVTGLYSIAAGVALAALVSLRRVLRTVRSVDTTPPEDSIPTVSVCIPARNEMHTLAACLDRVLSSDYPKLEILVLDDDSEDETSLMIKSYAHAGVRFIAGRPLASGWLGKNYALQTLLEAASGEYIVFMDVDTKIAVTTISRGVAHAQRQSAPLVSTIPHRADTYRLSTLFGSMRYLWTLLFIRSYTPASSAFWIVQRKKLLESGGFQTLMRDSLPEISVQALVGRGQLVDSFNLGVGFEKRWLSQVDTSTRLLKPMLGYRGLLVALYLCVVACVPWVLVIAAWVGQWPVFIAATATALGMLGVLLLFYRLQWSSRRLLAIVLGPLVMVQEVVVLLHSYYRYARGTVTWKGRAVELSTTSSLAQEEKS